MQTESKSINILYIDELDVDEIKARTGLKQ
jgi:hypothetical protein